MVGDNGISGRTSTVPNKHELMKITLILYLWGRDSQYAPVLVLLLLPTQSSPVAATTQEVL